MRLPHVRYATRSGRTSAGTTFDLSCATAVAWSDELLGWEWTMDDTTGAATRKARKFKLRVAMTSASEAASLLDLADRDASAGVEGTLTVGDGVDAWSLSCGVMSGSAIGVGPGFVVYELTMHSVRPVWRRYATHSLLPSPGSDAASGTAGLDLPTDLPTDLSGTRRATGASRIVARSECMLGFRFFGPCTNPYATVTAEDGTGSTRTNTYGVTGSCQYTSESIVIDPLGRGSIGASVYKASQSGARTNLYDSRRRGASGSGSYVFERMPAGTLTVSWPQTFGVDVTVIEERGALPWT